MSDLKFVQMGKKQDLEELYRFDSKAFAHLPGVEWSVAGLRKAQDDGWKIYSVEMEENIIAALFLRKDSHDLYTKNTSMKLEHQGNAYSHQIKDFYEEWASEHDIETLYNICAQDDFRTISLNETHGYARIGTNEEGFLTWKKELTKN